MTATEEGDLAAIINDDVFEEEEAAKLLALKGKLDGGGSVEPVRPPPLPADTPKTEPPPDGFC